MDRPPDKCLIVSRVEIAAELTKELATARRKRDKAEAARILKKAAAFGLKEALFYERENSRLPSPDFPRKWQAVKLLAASDIDDQELYATLEKKSPCSGAIGVYWELGQPDSSISATHCFRHCLLVLAMITLIVALSVEFAVSFPPINIWAVVQGAFRLSIQLVTHWLGTLFPT